MRRPNKRHREDQIEQVQQEFHVSRHAAEQLCQFSSPSQSWPMLAKPPFLDRIFALFQHRCQKTIVAAQLGQKSEWHDHRPCTNLVMVCKKCGDISFTELNGHLPDLVDQVHVRGNPITHLQAAEEPNAE